MKTVKLNTGHNMPIIGVGTYKITDKEDVMKVIETALSCGYRAFDTAQMYENEHVIGEALGTLLPKFKLKREDIFITSKLSTGKQGPAAEQAIQDSLDKLKTPYLDLFLIHWPKCDGLDIKDPENQKLRAQSYRAMECAMRQGKLRSIGVSNYTVKHLTEMLDPVGPFKCQIKPAVDQVEFNPYLYQHDLLDYCGRNGIQVEAFSSLGSQKSRDLVEDEVVKAVATKYTREPAQILLRWAIQHGVAVIPKSRNVERIRSNVEVMSFELADKDMKALDGLNKDKHCSSNPAEIV